MQWTDDVNIETPEQIDLALEAAGVGSRFVAQFLDWLVKGLVLLGVWLLLQALFSLLNYEVGRLELILIGSGVLVFLLLYDVCFEGGRNGQTPGKQWAGIRVIREGGGPLDFRSAWIRNLLGIADFLPACYLLGAILVMLTPRRQRLGDLAGGTMVIRERVTDAPGEVDEQVERLASDEFVFTPEHLKGCDPGDRAILRSFFQRFHQMQAQSRHQLAQRLGQVFLEKTAYQAVEPIRGSWRVEMFLASLYRDMEKWARHGQ